MASPPSTAAPDDAEAGPTLDPYRPLTRRRVALVVLLTLATVTAIAVAMLQPHRRLVAAKAARAEAAARTACPPGVASAAPGCPGGRMEVMVLPPTPAYRGSDARR